MKYPSVFTADTALNSGSRTWAQILSETKELWDREKVTALLGTTAFLTIKWRKSLLTLNTKWDDGWKNTLKSCHHIQTPSLKVLIEPYFLQEDALNLAEDGLFITILTSLPYESNLYFSEALLANQSLFFKATLKLLKRYPRSILKWMECILDFLECQWVLSVDHVEQCPVWPR